jgi:hypothetical protein
LRNISKHFYKPSLSSSLGSGGKITLIYPTHLFPVGDPDAQRIYDRVAAGLEHVLQVDRRAVDFAKEWATYQAFTEESYEDYFAPVGFIYYPHTSLPLMLPFSLLQPLTYIFRFSMTT